MSELIQTPVKICPCDGYREDYEIIMSEHKFPDGSTNLSGFYSTSLMPLDITWFTNWAGFEVTRIKEYDYVWGHLIASIPFDLQE